MGTEETTPEVRPRPETTSINSYDDGVWQAPVSCIKATASHVRAELDESIPHHEDGAWQTTLYGTGAVAHDVKAKLKISRTTLRATRDDVRNVAQKLPRLNQRRKYWRRNKIASGACVKISMNKKPRLLHFPRKYDAVLFTITDARKKWKSIRKQTRDQHYFTRGAVPWTAEIDDWVPSARHVSPMSKSEHWHVLEATRA